MNKELKRIYGEIKAIGEPTDQYPNGYLEGYANVIGTVDWYGDKTMPGAFVEDLPEFIGKGYLAVDHEWEIKDGAIGWIGESKEDPVGLWFRAGFHSDPDSQKIRTKVNERLTAGKEVGLSIGYYTIDSETVTENEETIRLLKRLRVKEVSVVFSQANDPSVVTDAKSSKFDEQYRAITDGLADLIGRVEAINDLGRGEAWKQARVSELRDLGSLALKLADRLEPQEPPKGTDPEPQDLSDERRQVALGLLKMAGITVN